MEADTTTEGVALARCCENLVALVKGRAHWRWAASWRILVEVPAPRRADDFMVATKSFQIHTLTGRSG